MNRAIEDLLALSIGATLLSVCLFIQLPFIGELMILVFITGVSLLIVSTMDLYLLLSKYGQANTKF